MADIDRTVLRATPNAPGRVVLLTGPSSSGKSTIARHLQDALPEPFLVLGVDTFVSMVPRRLKGPDATEGFRWVAETAEEGGAHTRVVRGEYGDRVIEAMQAALVAMARAGLNLIVEDVIADRAKLDGYLRALDGVDVTFFRLDAPLEILDERERQRPDRVRGTARGTRMDVARADAYDLVLDTSAVEPTDAAVQLAAAMRTPHPRAFDRLSARTRTRRLGR